MPEDRDSAPQLYRWFWYATLPERRGQVFRVVCRGAMNSCLIAFEDGFMAVTSRNALRRADDAGLPRGAQALG